MYRSIFITALAALFAPLVSAEGWACRNTLIEIACDDADCAVSETHTPMHVHIDEAGISACAYSGCWEGGITSKTSTGPFVSITAQSIPFSTIPENAADIALQLDRSTGVATLIVSGLFAHPMRCAPWARPVERAEDQAKGNP